MTGRPTWHLDIMLEGVCTVCGWRDQRENGPDLHRTHLTHILETQGGEVDHEGLRRVHATTPPRTATSAAPVTVWLSLDRETRRVAAQTHEPQDGDVPGGVRGVGWLWRQHEVDGDTWARMLAGGFSPAEQGLLHQTWWNQARADGEPEWPLIPGED